MSDIRFDPPAPPIPRGRAVREAFANDLRANPGQWALLGQHPSPTAARQFAYGIRSGKHTSLWLPAGAYETETRTVLGEHRVYVRYVGGDVA